MLIARFAELDDEDVAQLRRWLASLATRTDELRESYRQQGTRHEMFFLVRGARGPILIFISEVEDSAHASASFLRSRLPLDLEFKELVQEIVHGDAAVELLYDSSEYLGDADR